MGGQCHLSRTRQSPTEPEKPSGAKVHQVGPQRSRKADGEPESGPAFELTGQRQCLLCRDGPQQARRGFQPRNKEDGTLSSLLAEVVPAQPSCRCQPPPSFPHCLLPGPLAPSFWHRDEGPGQASAQSVLPTAEVQRAACGGQIFPATAPGPLRGNLWCSRVLSPLPQPPGVGGAGPIQLGHTLP